MWSGFDWVGLDWIGFAEWVPTVAKTQPNQFSDINQIRLHHNFRDHRSYHGSIRLIAAILLTFVEVWFKYVVERLGLKEWLSTSGKRCGPFFEKLSESNRSNGHLKDNRLTPPASQIQRPWLSMYSTMVASTLICLRLALAL